MTLETALGNLKIFGYLATIGLFEYLNIPSIQMWILAYLMIIDFITWVWKQYFLNPYEITSHKAWLGAIKKMSTLIIFLTLGLLFKWLDICATEYIKAIISVFLLAEAYSIIQNIYTIRTKQLLPEYDVISNLLKLIGDKIKQMIEKNLNNKKD